MKAKRYKNMLTGVQRKTLLRVIRGYRTISTEAAQVIAGAVPIHLLVEERAKKRSMQRQRQNVVSGACRRETMQRWQGEWEERSSKAEWTKTLIPDIGVWVLCGFRMSSFHLTQVLTGHGCFGTYTKRIGKTLTDECVYCGNGVTDDVQHTVFVCPRWEAQRSRTEMSLGSRLTVQNLISCMVSKREHFNTICKFAEEMLGIKEEDERRRQRGGIFP